MASQKVDDFSMDVFAYYDKDSGDDYLLPNTYIWPGYTWNG